jgi:hypothetical protein
MSASRLRSGWSVACEWSDPADMGPTIEVQTWTHDYDTAARFDVVWDGAMTPRGPGGKQSGGV